jgi:3-phenylpropionate/cinnamic acid dioxygenase small subunit
MPASVNGDTQQLSWRVEQLLFHEAALLDARRFDEWLELFSEDAIYEVRALGTEGTGSATGKAPEPTHKILTREKREFLTIRVARFERGLAACEMPASLTRRFVSNVTVEQGDEGELVVGSNFAIFQSRKAEDWIIGSRYDRLVPTADSFRIRHRCATLDYLTLPRTVTLLL